MQVARISEVTVKIHFMSSVEKQAEAAPVRFARGWTYGVASFAVLFVVACPAAAICGDCAPLVAWALTFGPGAIVVALAPWFQDSRRAWGFVLLSTALRLSAAGLGALAVLAIWPALPRDAFLLWLAGMYLIALAVEVSLTMANSSAQEGFRLLFPPDTSSSAQLREAGR